MKNDKRINTYSRDNQVAGMYSNPYHDKRVGEKDPEDLENDKWNPSPAQFQAFLDRDFALAQNNVTMTMLSRGQPMSVRELKDSSMHSVECIERVLTSKVTSGLLKEDQGRYELVR